MTRKRTEPEAMPLPTPKDPVPQTSGAMPLKMEDSGAKNPRRAANLTLARLDQPRGQAPGQPDDHSSTRLQPDGVGFARRAKRGAHVLTRLGIVATRIAQRSGRARRAGPGRGTRVTTLIPD